MKSLFLLCHAFVYALSKAAAKHAAAGASLNEHFQDQPQAAGGDVVGRPLERCCFIRGGRSSGAAW